MTTTKAQRQDRLTAAVDRQFTADSLVGSFFLGTPENQWQGCVLAEVAPGVYLCELFEWITGSSSAQQLVRIEEMAKFTFYDSAEWMNNTYKHEVGRKWEAATTQG